MQSLPPRLGSARWKPFHGEQGETSEVTSDDSVQPWKPTPILSRTRSEVSGSQGQVQVGLVSSPASLLPLLLRPSREGSGNEAEPCFKFGSWQGAQVLIQKTYLNT